MFIQIWLNNILKYYYYESTPKSHEDVEKNREKQKNLEYVNQGSASKTFTCMQYAIYIDRYNYNDVARVTYIYISLATGSEGD